MRSVRLTTGQTLVRFMAEQYVEQDRRQQRFIVGALPSDYFANRSSDPVLQQVEHQSSTM